MAITRDRIWAAADDLDAAGQKPTLAAVRKAVGGGSFTTIQEAMVAWKARKAAREVPERQPVPQAVADQLEALGAEVWTVALDLATARLAGERETLAAARAEMEAARRDAADLADQLNADLEETRARLEAVAGERDASRTEAGALRQSLAVAEAHGREMERRAAEGRDEAAQARRETTEARERAADLTGRLSVLEAQNAALLARLTSPAPAGPSA
ncbi:DNA-binding protein [Roseospira visakhapatnamensis]|uniref:Chromosome segregation ATPase n=1 Tax=Roseospira visakhapatnamensis TaxID=390880 RepID=A0A7W6WBC9_9PROT|nr:DNA-binding protein [Roseospira visakhapatnamensis]MBB4268205.1 chromosome segregation ATPase [Roseospira visakhapatnamensis]